MGRVLEVWCRIVRGADVSNLVFVATADCNVSLVQSLLQYSEHAMMEAQQIVRVEKNVFGRFN